MRNIEIKNDMKGNEMYQQREKEVTRQIGFKNKYLTEDCATIEQRKKLLEFEFF